MKCNHCGSEYEDHKPYCPQCGYSNSIKIQQESPAVDGRGMRIYFVKKNGSFQYFGAKTVPALYSVLQESDIQ